MAVSQLKKYSSADVSAPVINGNAGSLGAALKAILVDGYGVQTPAGWTEPVAAASNIYSFVNGTGSSQKAVVVNDNAPNVTSLGKEAWITGWESVASVTAPVGTGSGQFPTPAQLLTTGHAVIRKSTATGITARTWRCFADAHTCYMFIDTGDFASTYFPFYLGDLFAAAGVSDTYRFFVQGRAAENSTSAGSSLDVTDCFPYTSNLGIDLMLTSNAGIYMPRTSAGTGTSINMYRTGDCDKIIVNSPYNNIVNNRPQSGAIVAPNTDDNAYYLSAVQIMQKTGAGTFTIRGICRGMWFPLHPITAFTDGQVLSGAGLYAGKTFEVVKQGPTAGVWFIETSNTVTYNT